MLQERFFVVLAERMSALSWHASGQDPPIITPVEGRFWRPLPSDQASKHDFVATVQFICDQADDTRHRRRGENAESPILVEVDAGVTCPPLERLLSWLEARCCNVAVEVDLGTLVAPPRDVSVHIKKADEINSFITSVMILMDEHVDVFAADMASVDDFIAVLQSDSDFHEFEAEFVPAMLGAFGRESEARTALTRYAASAASHEYQVFSQRLIHFLDSGVPVSSLAYQSVNERRPPKRFGLRQTFAEAHKQYNVRQDAMKAVLEAGPGMTREQKRSMLEAELSRRGVDETAVWIEARLDTVEESLEPGGRGIAMKALGHIGRDAVRMVRRGAPQGPSWLEPPEPAFYKIDEPASQWVAVTLDVNVGFWLDRVFHATPHKISDMAMLKIWLTWDQAHIGDGSQLAVAVGSRRVGVLDRQITEVLSGVMTKAEEYNELPWTQGRLTLRHSEPRYILEAEVPLTND